jgi:hypothetical protein
MASWQPPIPAGALYSPAAIALGPGLALLAWCYDRIERDGSLQIHLESAAEDLGKPYGTVRDWWKALKEGPFFSEVTPQGRKGWRAKFKTKWVEWRIVEKNYPQRCDFSDDDSDTADISAGKKETPSKTNDVPNAGVLSDFSSLSDRRDLSDENNVYGTHDSDQADIAARAKSATALPASQGRKPPDRTPEQQAYLDRKKAIEQAYVAELGYTPAAFGKEAKSSKWLAEQSYTPEQVVKCYRHLLNDDFYAKQHISLATISKQIGAFVRSKNGRNGHIAGDLPLVTATDTPTKQIATPEERRRIIESRMAGK